MFSYLSLKVVHTLAVIVFASAVFAILSGAKDKLTVAILVVSSGLSALVGMFLIGVLGVGVPHWILGKFVMWIALTALPFIYLKKKNRRLFLSLWAAIILINLILVFYKP